jgi:hypothetical protein
LSRIISLIWLEPDQNVSAIVIDGSCGLDGLEPVVPDETPLSAKFVADARDSGITAVNLTVGEVGNGLSFFGCGHRSPRLEELCRMLSAREACGLGHSRLERGIGMEYRFFKKVRSPSSALDGRAF